MTGTRAPLVFWPVLVIALLLAVEALKLTASVAIPLLVAFFVAIAIAPVEGWARRHLPDALSWVAHVLSMLVILVILAVFFAGIALAARAVVDKFPTDIPSSVGSLMGKGDIVPSGSQDTGAGESRTTDPDTHGSQMAREDGSGERTGEEGSGGETGEARGGGAEQSGGAAAATGQSGQEGPSTAGESANGDAAAGGGGGGDGGLRAELRGLTDEVANLLRDKGVALAGTVLNRTASVLSALALILFLSLFMLIEAPQWRDKISAIMDPDRRESWLNAIEDTARSLRLFFVAKTATGAMTALLYVLWLWVMGVDLLIVWGVVTFLLSYIPVAGSLIAGILASGYAFYQLGLSGAAIVALGLLVIEQVMGNLVEPRFLGRQLSLSGFAVLVFLLAWSWVWGVAGALLSTPILIFVTSTAAHIDRLRPVAVLLSADGEKGVRELRKEG